MGRTTAVAMVCVSLTAVGTLLQGQTPPTALPFRNPALTTEARAADLVSRLTLEEKAAQLRHAAPAIDRLGIPEYNWWSEGLHGVARAGVATVFPQAIGLAATFDAPMVERVAEITGTEFRAKYLATRRADGGSEQYRGLTVWSPNINIFRDPRWGRGQETFGEDPYLTSRMGVAFIGGLQGTDPRMFRTIATAKHFAVHSGPEADRHREDVHPSPHDLEDTYLPAFRAAVIEGRAQAIMCAYNAIDGVPACASPLIEDLVRRRWRFTGHVVSDCAAVADIFLETSHRYRPTPEEAVAAALTAGTDLICAEFGPDKSADPAYIVNAVRRGLLAEAVVDRAARRLFEARISLGLLDASNRHPYSQIAATNVDTPAHRALNLDAARASLVLLKNDGLLPLRRDPKRIAVIGPNADSVDALVGNYNGTPSNPVTVLGGLRQRFPRAEIIHVEGTGLVGPPLERVPDSAFCLDAECGRRGLAVERFGNPNLEGPAGGRETDINVRFGWGRPNREERNTSMRWTGFVRADETGRYRFRLNSESGYRLRIADTIVMDAWDATDPASIGEGEITLQAGRSYPFVLEARQRGSRGDQTLVWSRESRRGDAAVAAARSADLIVFAGGLTARLEGEEMRVNAQGFAGGDRTSLDLPAPQHELLQRLHATGKPIVLVLMSGSALGVNWADRRIPAIVHAWYPGGEGGRAIAELLAGDFSPSGRLPVTFYRSVDQLPAFKDYRMAGRTYRYFRGEPLYPFGHGLSYSHFVYGTPRLSRQSVEAGQPVQVSVSVTNSGARDADEVVQLYVSRPGPGAPVRSLRGFQRIRVARGETRVVSFEVDEQAMSLVHDDGQRVVDPGRVDVWIGGGQPRVRQGLPPTAGAAATFRVIGRKRLFD